MILSIQNYHRAQTLEDRAICNRLYQIISTALPEAESKVWHAHPVWFLDDNPIVGYHKLKNGIRLLFWSGGSFEEENLQSEGKFKAAEIYYRAPEEINEEELKRWLEKARHIQWDYKNIVKRKGELLRLK